MMLLRYIFLVLFVFSIGIISAQDMHYSNYHFTPLTVNPALAGAFSGSYRVGGIYKSQFFNNSNTSGYSALNLFADAPIIKGFRKQDWIGIGLETNVIGWSGKNQNANRDLGDKNYDLNWLNFKVGGAYHFSLDKKQTNILTLGAQYNSSNMNFNNLSNLDSRYGIVNMTTDPDIMRFNSMRSADPNQQGVPFNFKDWNVGLLFNARRKNADLKVGAAVEGFLRPNITSVLDRKALGLNIHGELDLSINKKTNIIPAVYYYSIGAANALNANGRVKYLLNEEKEIKLVGGVGVRNFRQILILAGMEYKEYQFGASYDVDISDLAPANGHVGGFEISMIYMGKIYKRPKPDPVIFCPRL